MDKINIGGTPNPHPSSIAHLLDTANALLFLAKASKVGSEEYKLL